MHKIFLKHDYYVSMIKTHYLINDHLSTINLINSFHKLPIAFDKISNKKATFGHSVSA